jgi:hypothetical protein
MSVLGIVTDLFFGSKADNANNEAVRLQNEAMDAQFQYDTDAYLMNAEAMVENREFAIQQIQESARQEGMIAKYKDAMKVKTYNYNLAIRDRQEDLNDRMYLKSEDIYSNQLTINAKEERFARMDERRQMQEIDTENRYQQNDVMLEALEAEGAIRARGITGRSAEKLKSVQALKASTKLSLLDMSLDNATTASRSTLRAIGEQRNVADLNAFAAKMLDPGTLPMPITPLATPQANFIYPRLYEDFDFGPEPIRGAKASGAAASAQIWGQTAGSIASRVGDMFESNTFKLF